MDITESFSYLLERYSDGFRTIIIIIKNIISLKITITIFMAERFLRVKFCTQYLVKKSHLDKVALKTNTACFKNRL